MNTEALMKKLPFELPTDPQKFIEFNSNFQKSSQDTEMQVEVGTPNDEKIENSSKSPSPPALEPAKVQV